MQGVKYKVGDKVLIAYYNPEKRYLAGFAFGMRQYSGKIMTISNIYHDADSPDYFIYNLLEDNHRYFWSTDMFLPSNLDTSIFIDIDLIMV